VLSCIRLAPSGESYGCNRRSGGKYRRVDGSVTCGLTACRPTPGSAPGPTLGNEYRKTSFIFTLELNSNRILRVLGTSLPLQRLTGKTRPSIRNRNTASGAPLMRSLWYGFHGTNECSMFCAACNGNVSTPCRPTRKQYIIDYFCLVTFRLPDILFLNCVFFLVVH